MEKETITITRDAVEAIAKILGLPINTQPEPPTKWEDIKTFEDACMVVPPNESQRAILALAVVDKDVRACQAVMKLTIIARAMNKLANKGTEWLPDWTNSSEYKYYPWLEFKAGSGFSDSDGGCDDSDSHVGSRLCFRSSDMARHAATHFTELYNDFFTL